jgi:hypothetical protein
MNSKFLTLKQEIFTYDRIKHHAENAEAQKKRVRSPVARESVIALFYFLVHVGPLISLVYVPGLPLFLSVA